MSSNLVDLAFLRVDVCPGPWASLGVHVDLARPTLDLHVLWWVVSVGRVYRAG